MLQKIAYGDSKEIMFLSMSEMSKNNINLRESNHQRTGFATDEEIENYKYHLCIIGTVQMMLLPSA